MKKTMILLFWLVAGAIALAQSPLYETSSSSTRSEHKLQMQGGTNSWNITPMSGKSLRSSGGSRNGISGGGLVGIGAGAPQVIIGGGQMPQVQFGRGGVGNGELVSDPTQTNRPRRLGEEDDDDDPNDRPEPHPNPIGDMEWWVVLIGILLFAFVKRLKRAIN
ncbi:MAG: hypothetical protein IJ834_05295 [Paludibacteraceae bacterium]|nr:hypothetical protein [Paludibacteraceae bacterium]